MSELKIDMLTKLFIMLKHLTAAFLFVWRFLTEITVPKAPDPMNFIGLYLKGKSNTVP